MQQAAKDQHVHGLVAADLSRRHWQDREQCADCVAKERGTKGDGVADGPEGQHSKEAIAKYRQAG